MSKTTKTATSTKATKVNASANGEKPAVREPHWSDRRKAVVLAMRKLNATSANNGATISEIAAAAAKLGAKELADDSEYCGRKHKGEFLTFVCLDAYKTAELVYNGFAASNKVDGERGLRYYLTAKGKTTKMVNKE